MPGSARPVSPREVAFGYCLSVPGRRAAPPGCRWSFTARWLQPDEWLAGADRVTVLDQPFDDRGRERRRHQVAAAAHVHVPELGAAADLGARAAARVAGTERPGQRRDQQPPLGRVTVRVGLAVLGDQAAGGLQV